MARKPRPGVLPADPVTPAPGTLAGGTEPDGAQTFEIELPPELAHGDLAPPVPVVEPGPGAPVAPVVPVVPPPPEPITFVATPKPGSALANLEAARRVYAEELARARATQRPADKPTDFDFHDETDYDKLGTITEGWKTGGKKLGQQLVQRFKTDLSAALAEVKYENALARFRLSDSLWSRLKPDYQETVTKAGLLDKIAVDETGKPKHPDKYDPLLWQMLLLHPDPGQYAYSLAKELLEQGQAAQTQAGGGNGAALTTADLERAREEGRREADAERIRGLEAAASRPVGIAGIPTGSGVRRTISLTDIGAMSDAQQAWIQEHYPERWDAYKRSLFGLSPK